MSKRNIQTWYCKWMYVKITKCQKVPFYGGMVWMLNETKVTCNKQSRQRDTSAAMPEISYALGARRDLSMNFFLVKHSHHLEGFPSGVLKTRSHTRRPVSCRSCWRYCCINSGNGGRENKINIATWNLSANITRIKTKYRRVFQTTQKNMDKLTNLIWILSLIHVICELGYVDSVCVI